GENPDYNGDPLTSNRWGWTNFFMAEQYVNHTTEEDAIRLTMYAGAGQCDTMKGDIAGTLKLWFINSDLNNPEVGILKVKFDMEDTEGVNQYVLNGVHLYVGCDPYPLDKKKRPTVAPGQYPQNPKGSIDKQLSYTMDVAVAGDFYLIAHADVCTSNSQDYMSQLVNEISLSRHGGEFIYSQKGKGISWTGCQVPKGNGKEDRSSISTLEGQTSDVTIYPVPFVDEINLEYEFEYTSDVEINIFDMRGKHLRTYKDSQVTRGSKTSLNIDFALKANQTYMVQVVTDREKFVKQIVSDKNKRK